VKEWVKAGFARNPRGRARMLRAAYGPLPYSNFSRGQEGVEG